MKVDVINTMFGDIEVEYSTFKKGFFLKNLPPKLREINGLKIYLSRDNSFDKFSELESYVKDLIKDSCVDFQFKRKVIIYKIRQDENYFSFKYMLCDESEKTQRYQGRDNELCEYIVLESNMINYKGSRNIFGQITGDNEKNWVFLDYNEDTYNFIKNFDEKFNKLKFDIVEFFKEDSVKANILNSNVGKLLSGSN